MPTKMRKPLTTVERARKNLGAAVASFMLTMERIYESTGLLQLNSTSSENFRMFKAVLHNFLMMSASKMIRQAQANIFPSVGLENPLGDEYDDESCEYRTIIIIASNIRT